MWEGVFRDVSEGAFIRLLVYVSENTTVRVYEDAFEGMWEGAIGDVSEGVFGACRVYNFGRAFSKVHGGALGGM